MKKNALQLLAQRAVLELLKLDASGPQDPATDLRKVRDLRAFMRSPESPEEGESIARELQRVPSPAGTSLTMVNACPYSPGQVVTQRVPAQGEAPVYAFPLPGQPVRVIGAPVDFVVPDGSRWCDETGRWVCEDLRVIVATPGGPLVLTVDSEEFNPWTPNAPKWSEIEADRDEILDTIEKGVESALRQLFEGDKAGKEGSEG